MKKILLPLLLLQSSLSFCAHPLDLSEALRRALPDLPTYRDANTQTEAGLPIEEGTQTTPPELTQEAYKASIESTYTLLEQLPEKNGLPIEKPFIVYDEALRTVINLTAKALSSCKLFLLDLDNDVERFNEASNMSLEYQSILRKWGKLSDKQKRAWKIVEGYEEGIPFVFSN